VDEKELPQEIRDKIYRPKPGEDNDVEIIVEPEPTEVFGDDEVVEITE